MAQDFVVIGQVRSAEDGEPLPSANVWLKRSGQGTITNDDGFFMLRGRDTSPILVVSVVGYKTYEKRLEKGKDQMVEIYLKEDISLIDEIVAMPNQDGARKLLKEVRRDKDRNNPQKMRGLSTERTTTTSLNLVNIKSRHIQKRIFRELRNGVVSTSDTTYSLPVYIAQERTRIDIGADTSHTETLDAQENAIRILPSEQWKQVIANYTPEINFYKPYSTILGANFMNPTAQTAHNYYNLYLSDSIAEEGNKHYEIRFSPKIDAGSLLKGSMWIDSASHAITGIDAKIGTTGSVNFLNAIDYKYATGRHGSVYYPQEERKAVGVRASIIPIDGMQFLGAILQADSRYTSTRLHADTMERAENRQDTTWHEDNGRMDELWSRIDTINQSKIQRLAAWVVDLILFQHLHIWKIDLGPLPNLVHYNRMEGIVPQITLRSGETFSKNFTFGGYYGYGTLDRQHKIGGNIQWRFGPSNRNTISFFYDNKTVRYGYDDVETYTENRIHDLEHIGNIVSQLRQFPTMSKRAQLKMRHIYEENGIKVTTTARAYTLFGNSYIPYIHYGRLVERIDGVTLSSDVRLSWGQHTLDGYFHRKYLSSRNPTVHLNAEAGYYSVGEYNGFYGKFGIYAQQHIPVGFGKMHWMAQANAIVGDVPWPLLVMPRSSRGVYTNATDFRLLNQMEFASDIYISANLRYQTRGYLFGYIPVVKRLGIKEDIIFNIGYGTLRDKHQRLLTLPTLFSSWDKTPYIEAGFGLSNILYLGNLEFVWRITHRDNPFGTNFGIRWCIEI